MAVGESDRRERSPADATLPVTCTFDATGLAPGLRQGAADVPHRTRRTRCRRWPVDFTVRFLDVADASLFQAFIYGAAGAGVMPGCDPAAFLFCPAALVTRADMAGFILRAVHGAAFVPTPYAGAFDDVQAGDYNADYIQSFFEEGYTAGCGGGNFCPDAVHTRGQTAVFILKGDARAERTCRRRARRRTCSTTCRVRRRRRRRSETGSGSCSLEGITAGCGGNDFCPGAGIPNEQMATFLVKAFAHPAPVSRTNGGRACDR